MTSDPTRQRHPSTGERRSTLSPIGDTPYLLDSRGRRHTHGWLAAMPAGPRERYALALHAYETALPQRAPPGRCEVLMTAFTSALMAERDAELSRQQAERLRGKNKADYRDARAVYVDAAERHQRALELLLRIEELPERRSPGRASQRDASALSRIRGAGVADDLL